MPAKPSTWSTCSHDSNCMAAGRLVAYSRLKKGDYVLDVAAGTGIVSIPAARRGARVVALDISPELLDRAKQNAAVAEVDLECVVADAHVLPFETGTFD